MRLARIAHPDGVAFVSVGESGDEPGSTRSATVREIADHPFGTPTYTGRSWPLADTRLLAPILPSKVIGIGRNYADHAAELGNELPTTPMIFLKPSTAVIGPNAPSRSRRTPAGSTTRASWPSSSAAPAGTCAPRTPRP